MVGGWRTAHYCGGSNCLKRLQIPVSAATCKSDSGAHSVRFGQLIQFRLNHAIRHAVFCSVLLPLVRLSVLFCCAPSLWLLVYLYRKKMWLTFAIRMIIVLMVQLPHLSSSHIDSHSEGESTLTPNVLFNGTISRLVMHCVVELVLRSST